MSQRARNPVRRRLPDGCEYFALVIEENARRLKTNRAVLLRQIRGLLADSPDAASALRMISQNDTVLETIVNCFESVPLDCAFYVRALSCLNSERAILTKASSFVSKESGLPPVEGLAKVATLLNRKCPITTLLNDARRELKKIEKAEPPRRETIRELSIRVWKHWYQNRGGGRNEIARALVSPKASVSKTKAWKFISTLDNNSRKRPKQVDALDEALKTVSEAEAKERATLLTGNKDGGEWPPLLDIISKAGDWDSYNVLQQREAASQFTTGH